MNHCCGLPAGGRGGALPPRLPSGVVMRHPPAPGRPRSRPGCPRRPPRGRRRPPFGQAEPARLLGGHLGVAELDQGLQGVGDRAGAVPVDLVDLVRGEILPGLAARWASTFSRSPVPCQNSRISVLPGISRSLRRTLPAAACPGRQEREVRAVMVFLKQVCGLLRQLVCLAGWLAGPADGDRQAPGSALPRPRAPGSARSRGARRAPGTPVRLGMPRPPGDDLQSATTQAATDPWPGRRRVQLPSLAWLRGIFQAPPAEITYRVGPQPPDSGRGHHVPRGGQLYLYRQWSRPFRIDVCSMFARTRRYGPVLLIRYPMARHRPTERPCPHPADHGHKRTPSSIIVPPT